MQDLAKIEVETTLHAVPKSPSMMRAADGDLSATFQAGFISAQKHLKRNLLYVVETFRLA